MSEREREARRAKLDALRSEGVDPYPARAGDREPLASVRERFASHDGESLEADPQHVAVTGRVMALRSFGKLVFATLLENGEKLQISARKAETTPEVFAFVKGLDLGDIIRVAGPVWRTKSDELTVDVREATLLAKGLRPLPEKWHGLSDVEARFRQRYLDLLVNDDARRVAVQRSGIVRAMRASLDARGFLEVETPVLQPIYGGAAARPFTTHHNAYDQELFLRISDELYLKRLVVGGLDRVYEIGRVFRNEGVSRKHNPEFTMMECYQAYADYHDMMALAESLVQECAERALGATDVTYQGQTLHLGGEWRRVTLQDVIGDQTGIDILANTDLGSLSEAMRQKGWDPGDAPNWARLVDDLFSDHVEATLIQPTLVTDYPVELSPLAKRRADDPRLVERFEPFLAGMEIGNAFSELNDPDDQRERLLASRSALEAGDEEAHPLDEDYLRALEVGLPPTGGLGIGVDRLVMILCDAPNLREVVTFPHMRPRADGDPDPDGDPDDDPNGSQGEGG